MRLVGLRGSEEDSYDCTVRSMRYERTRIDSLAVLYTAGRRVKGDKKGRMVGRSESGGESTPLNARTQSYCLGCPIMAHPAFCFRLARHSSGKNNSCPCMFACCALMYHMHPQSHRFATRNQRAWLMYSRALSSLFSLYLRGHRGSSHERAPIVRFVPFLWT